MTKTLKDVLNLDKLYGQKASDAQHEVGKLVRRLDETHTALLSSVRKAEGRTAEHAALIYLRNADLPEALAELAALADRMSVIGKNKEKLLSGAVLRVESALKYVTSGQADAFERAQVLVQATRDFAARLIERQLVGEVETTRNDATYITARKSPPSATRNDGGCGLSGQDFALAA